MAGKLRMVHALLSCGASPRKPTSLGDAPAHEAAYEGHPEIVKLLHEYGADLDIGNAREVTPLMVAAYADSAGIIKYIVDAKSDLSKVDKDGRNAVFYAVVEGKLDTLLYLIDSGVPVRPDHHRVTVFMEAVYHMKMEVVHYVLENHDLLDIDLNAVDRTGRNVLFYLSHHEDPSLLELLLHWDIALEPTNDGRSLLMSAALHNNHPLTLYLISNCYKLGLDINEKDNKGRNVHFYCITGGDVALLELLITHHVPVQASTDGVTILMQAVAKNKPDVIQYLIEKMDTGEIDDLDLNARDADGWDAIMYATASANMVVFEQLTQVGARCQSAGDGRNVIMQAASKGQLDFLKYLLHHSHDLHLDLHAEDLDGWNSLFYAVQGGQMDAFRLLLRSGAKVTSAHNGSTLLTEAVDKNRLDFVSFLLQKSQRLVIDVEQRDHQGNNALFYAAATGNLDVFNQLLDAGCPVVNDLCNRSLLMQAILHGHAHMLAFMLEHKTRLSIDVHQKDVDGRNLFFYCVEGGHLDLLKVLLDLNCGLQFLPDAQGRTNLMQACRVGHLDIVTFLLQNASQHSLDINALDVNEENAIFYAARAGSLEIIKELLNAGVFVRSNKAMVNVLPQCLSEEKWGIVHTILNSNCDLQTAINSKDIKGRTVLHHFVEKGKQDLLMTFGKYYNVEADRDLMGTSMLMLACKHAPNLNTIRYLLGVLKVDVAQVDVRKRTALFYAVESTNVQVVEMLLERVIQIESDCNGRSLLHVAVATGNHYVVDALLQSKFGKQLVNGTDNQGRTEMHYAALHGYTSLVELLATHCAHLDIQDKEGLTPLMHACVNSRAGALGTLLRKGADLKALDSGRRTALHHCLLSSNPSLRCVKLLAKYGVDVNVQDNTGQTALMTACEIHAETHISVIRFLVHHEADPVLQDTEGKDSFDHCPFNAEYVKALMRDSAEMSQHEQETLKLFHRQLLEQLRLTPVLIKLLQHKIITRTLNFEVEKKASEERIPRLLDLLVYRGDKAFRVFCQVLRDTGLVELAYIMLKQAYVPSTEIYW